MNAIPYLDLSRARRRIADRLAPRWQAILDANAFVLGPEVEQFERAFAAFLDVPGVIGVANGTDALVVALRALGLAPGDEVIVPAFSFFATAEAVVLAGGTPVFADVLPETLNLDPADAARRVTARTVGVIGVHLYGRPFDAGALGELCRARGLWLVEDAAQAHGARYRGRRVGTLGELAAWSFYPTKNLGAFGDAGALSGRDPELLARARIYAEGLAGVGDVRLPVDHPGDECVVHQMTILTARRDELMAFLRQRGVGSSVHYPSPLHRQPAIEAIRGGAAPEPMRVAEQVAREVLCLPMFAELELTEAEAVVAAVRDFWTT